MISLILHDEHEWISVDLAHFNLHLSLEDLIQLLFVDRQVRALSVRVFAQQDVFAFLSQFCGMVSLGV